MQDIALFPPEARCVFYLTGNAGRAVDLTRYEHLHPAERDVVGSAVDVRKGEFGDARWCAHQAVCPAWGGTPPALPEDATQLALDPRSAGRTSARADDGD